MFKILAGDYGNPPKSETWLFGQFLITPSDEVELLISIGKSPQSNETPEV